MRIEVAHTSAIDSNTLDVARALLEDAFEERFGLHDWEHTLGGTHVLVWHGRELIGHGFVVRRCLLYEGRALRCGYVEAVAVRPDRQRLGHGSAIMGPSR